MALNIRQMKFVEFYILYGNASKAAKMAGYSEKASRESAGQLLTNINILDAVAKRRAELAKRMDISHERIIRELAAIGFARISDHVKYKGESAELLSSDERTDEELAAVQEVSSSPGEHGSTVKIKLHDKLKALELLGKKVGFFDSNGKDKGGESSDDIKGIEDALEEVAKTSSSEGTGTP